MHVTPELMVYVGMMSDDRGDRWKMESSYRSNGRFTDATGDWDWDSMSHTLVESGLSRIEAKAKQLELIDAAGAMSLNTRNRKSLERNIVEMELPTKKQCNMKKVRKETKRKNTISGVKVELMIDNRYRQQDGRYAVTIRVYSGGKYVYLQTGYSMTPSEFDSMDTKTEETLDIKYNIVCDYIREKTDVGSFALCAVKGELEQKLLGKTEMTDTLVGLIMEKRQMFTNPCTIINYDVVCKHLKEMYPDGLPLVMVGKETIGAFKKHLHGKGLCDTTLNIYLSVVKACVNYGIYKGMIKQEQYPFKRNAVEVDKVALPKSAKRDTAYLTKSEMRAVWDYFIASKKKNRKVGYFLFSYLHGGMNLADLMGLKFDDLYFQEGGFVYQRKKTVNRNSFKVVVPATSWTEKLLDALGIVPKSGEYVFPELSYTTEREYIKKKNEVASYIYRVLERVKTAVGLPKTISMTTARHTFATVATKERMPYSMVERCMGHAQNGVSSHYVGGFSVDEMRSDFEKLL